MVKVTSAARPSALSAAKRFSMRVVMTVGLVVSCHPGNGVEGYLADREPAL